MTECVDDCLKFLVENGVLSTHASDSAQVSTLYDFSEQLAKEAEELESIEIDDERIQLLHCLADGWAGKLNCFMNELELLESLHYKTVTSRDGQRFLHSVPITCPVSTEVKEKLAGQTRVALRHHTTKEVLAVIEKPDFYSNRKEEISARLFGTQSKLHPKVELIYSEGDWLLTGDSLKVTSKILYNDGLDEYRLSPSQVQEQAKLKKADVVYAFQLRNPLHNGHVMLLNSTRDMLIEKGYKNPVLLLHPCGGWTKDDDVPLDTRMKQHQAIIDDGELSADSTILAIWPSPMFYGGPSEVLWHVASRLNAGVEYFIVGRDPAGIGHPEVEKTNLYDPFHGQKVIDLGKHNFSRHVDIVPFKVAAYNKVNKKMEFFNPQKADEFDFISGSRMRQLARDGETPPEGFMNQKGWEILNDYYTQLKNQN